MITCEEASRLVSDRLQRRLGLRERTALRLHLMLCDGCRRFVAQMRWLQRYLRGATEREPASLEPAAELGADARARIVARLREAVS